METIEWRDFERVEIRVGRALGAEPFEKAREPACCRADVPPRRTGRGLRKRGEDRTRAARRFGPAVSAKDAQAQVRNFPQSRVFS